VFQVKILFWGLNAEFWIPCYSVVPKWGYGGRLTWLWFLISREFRIKYY